MAILIVNDEPMQGMMIEHIVKKSFDNSNTKIKVAGGGHEAISFANTTAFDLIIMDLQMIDLDGFEASRLIRKNHEEKQNSGGIGPFIVALTAGIIDNAIIDACKDVGINDWLTAPITTDDIKGRILPNMNKRIADHIAESPEPSERQINDSRDL